MSINGELLYYCFGLGRGFITIYFKFSVPYAIKHKNVLSFKCFEYQEHLNEIYKPGILIVIKTFDCIIISPQTLFV